MSNIIEIYVINKLQLYPKSIISTYDCEAYFKAINMPNQTFF